MLLDLAQSALDRETERRAARSAAEDAVKEWDRNLKTRTQALDKARGADREWVAAWDAAVSQCWFGGDGHTLSTGSVRRILTETAALGPALDKRDDLGRRIEAMEADKASYIADVKSIVAELGMAFNEEAPLDAADALRIRQETAKRNRQDRADRSKELDDAEARRRSVAEQMAVDAALVTEMTRFFGVATMAEVNEKRDHVIHWRELRGKAADLERRILDTLELPSMAEAESTLADVDGGALRSEREELDARLRDQDQRREELYAAHSKAEDAVNGVGGDDAAARIEEKRQTVLQEIEERTLDHLRIRLGTEVAERALRLYRDKHRGSMMDRASDAFRTIGQGYYSGLSTQPDGDREVLIGIGADGNSKIASELSKGVHFQLYLALRMAGYHEFVRARDPLPFIGDDIMETFDDFRAEEAFRLFTEMARVGQVIYLTHHRHLREIAREICPTVTIHELPSPMV